MNRRELIEALERYRSLEREAEERNTLLYDIGVLISENRASLKVDFALSISDRFQYKPSVSFGPIFGAGVASTVVRMLEIKQRQTKDAMRELKTKIESCKVEL